MKKNVLFSSLLVITLALTACSASTDAFASVAPKGDAANFVGQTVVFRSTINDHSQISVGGETFQLNVVIEAARVTDIDRALNFTRLPHMGDKGILVLEDGKWYIDIILDE
jgi:hypothetical protein